MKLKLLLSCLIISLTLTSLHAQTPQDITVITERVTENYYNLKDDVIWYGNTGAYIYDTGVLLIDTKAEDLIDQIKDALAQITDKPVTYVVNTHCHYDHVYGNMSFAAGGAKIIAHDNAYERMTKEQDIFMLGFLDPPVPAEGLPTITYKKALTIRPGDKTAMIINLGKGHTDGDSIVYLPEENIIHMGDLYFSHCYPYIGINQGGSIITMITYIQKALRYIDNDTIVIPGHGEISNKEELKLYHKMLKRIAWNIAIHIKRGKSLEEVIAAQPTQDFDADFNQLFEPDFFTELVYHDLMRHLKK